LREIADPVAVEHPMTLWIPYSAPGLMIPQAR
jgi:hypothetical protein